MSMLQRLIEHVREIINSDYIQMFEFYKVSSLPGSVLYVVVPTDNESFGSGIVVFKYETLFDDTNIIATHMNTNDSFLQALTIWEPVSPDLTEYEKYFEQ